MKICLPIKEKTQDRVLQKLKKVSQELELAEIWMDQVQDLNLKELISHSPLPLILTCKNKMEKGAFKLGWEAMTDLFLKACEFRPRYLDISFLMPEKLNKKIVQKAQENKIKILLSHHDFQKTPPFLELQKKALVMKKKAVDIIKIATLVKKEEDLFNLIALALWLKKKKIRHIVIGLGPLGRLTRLLSDPLGNEFMFAVLTKKEAEWGQLTVEEMKSFQELA